VDAFYTLSGFLLSCQLLSKISKGKKLEYLWMLVNRALRIWPCTLIVVLMVVLLGDVSYTKMIILNVLFVHNYMPYDHDSFTMGPMWSNGPDFQMFAILPLLFYGLHKLKLLNSKSLFFLLGLSILIPALLFHPELRNSYHASLDTHYIYMMTDEASKWLKSQYGFE